MFFLKLLFPKLWFGFDGDPNGGGGDPSGQHSSDAGGNDGDPSGGGQSPTEIAIGDSKVSLDDLRQNPALKAYFDAYDNREKWQSENTRRAQQLKQLERDASAYQRLKSDPRFQQLQNPQPTNRLDAIKQDFLQKATAKYGSNVDTGFMEMLFESVAQLSDYKAQEVVAPFQTQYLSNWEKGFLKDHPLIRQGDDKYQELSERIRQGYDPEDAYHVVYREEIMNAEIENRIKKRDEENKLKLQRSRQPGGTSGKKTKPASFDDAFEEAWAEHSDR